MLLLQLRALSFAQTSKQMHPIPSDDRLTDHKPHLMYPPPVNRQSRLHPPAQLERGHHHSAYPSCLHDRKGKGWVLLAHSARLAQESNVQIVKAGDLSFTCAFSLSSPEERLGISDVSLLSGISGLSFDSLFLSPLLFFLPSPLVLSVLSFFC